MTCYQHSKFSLKCVERHHILQLLFLDERDFTVRLGILIEGYALDDRDVVDARRFLETREAEPII